MLGNPIVMWGTTALYFVFVFFIYPKLCLPNCSPALKIAINIFNLGYFIFVIANSIAYAKKYILKSNQEKKP
ncbi:MAG: hypothetical protein JHC31_04405 [Sulfurihydrogenibium sp.]|jgi:hypothetical protein|nr:hypothetical protein [Sulfurihydrogenibium sp.]